MRAFTAAAVVAAILAVGAANAFLQAPVTGGPIRPSSSVPATTGRVFDSTHVGAGSGSKHDQGVGVQGNLGADARWNLRFDMPPALPTGTAKIRMRALASATTGAAKVNVQWASVAMEEDPSSAVLNAEGTATLTWGAGDADQYKELTINLDADTIVVNEVLVMDVVFETTGWTLSSVSTWSASVIWE